MAGSSPFEVKEVRVGLFRIHWLLDDLPVNCECRKFQLIGSQSGRTFVISYTIEKVAKYSRLFQTRFCVEEVSHKDSDDRSDVPKKQKSKRQKLDSTVSRTKDGSWIPYHMWISYKRSLDEVNLSMTSSGKWLHSSSYVELSDAITLSIDFGNITNGLTKLFLSQQLCDDEFKFKCGQSIGAHVAILSAGSPVFSVMFSSGFLESQTRKVAIDDIDIGMFRELLIYLYSGTCTLKLTRYLDENCYRYQHLFEAADKYDVVALKTMCEDRLLALRMTFASAISRIIFAKLHSIPKLFENSVQFLVNNSRELCYQPEWLDFMKTHPDLCVLVTQRLTDPPFSLRRSLYSSVCPEFNFL